jgi:hypothetical protein
MLITRLWRDPALRRRAMVALLGWFAGCVDEPVRVAPYGGGTPADRLSELGLFADPVAQVPADGVIAYDVAAPLWSDGASKLRFIAAPVPLATSSDRWTFGPGTYLVKTFHFPHDLRDPTAGDQLVETRVIAFGVTGATAATYVWNDAQTDAFASGGNLDVPVAWIDLDGQPHRENHHVPGTSQCDSCHRGGALGVRSPEVADIPTLVAAGVADHAPDGVVAFVDPYGDAPIGQRASSYLEINCAHCHSPGGEAAGTHADWRRDQLATDVCRDANHSLDGRDRIIDPGHPERSVVIARLRAGDPFVHMPRGPSHVIDERGVAMIEAWISSLPAGCP